MIVSDYPEEVLGVVDSMQPIEIESPKNGGDYLTGTEIPFSWTGGPNEKNLPSIARLLGYKIYFSRDEKEYYRAPSSGYISNNQLDVRLSAKNTDAPYQITVVANLALNKDILKLKSYPRSFEIIMEVPISDREIVTKTPNNEHFTCSNFELAWLPHEDTRIIGYRVRMVDPDGDVVPSTVVNEPREVMAKATCNSLTDAFPDGKYDWKVLGIGDRDKLIAISSEKSFQLSRTA